MNYQPIKYATALLLLGYVLFTVSACSKSFLDQKATDGTNTSGAITNEASMYTALVGLYSSLRATDFYGRTFAIKGDLMSDDCFLSSSNSGRYLGFNNYDMDKTNSYPSAIWQNAYAAIKNCNFILNAGVANNSNVISQMYAEVYAIRGMVYFDLLRNFSKPYAAGATNLGVPIVLKFDSLALPKRDTISKVYAQVLSDLTTAFSLAKYDNGSTMSFSSTGVSRVMNSSYITKYAIEGLLARVYQHMGNWTAARDAALDVVTKGDYKLVESSGLVGYWAGTTPRTDKVETLFEVTSDANNNVSDGTLANIYVAKAFGGSYGDILPTKALYTSYATTDARKQLYMDTTRSGQVGRAYYVTKYPINTATYDDVKIVRYAELLLILSEAYYNLTDEVNALKYLNMVAQKRDPVFTGYTATGTALQDAILNERMKELAFEGYRFWDLYRLQKTFTKAQAQDGSSNISKSVTVTPATTNMIFPIPNDEILVNSNLKQNDGY
jgi:starch-binding outer membrane protein, SusD/RagB family